MSLSNQITCRFCEEVLPNKNILLWIQDSTSSEPNQLIPGYYTHRHCIEQIHSSQALDLNPVSILHSSSTSSSVSPTPPPLLPSKKYPVCHHTDKSNPPIIIVYLE